MKGYVPGFQPPDEQAFIKLNTNENSVSAVAARGGGNSGRTGQGWGIAAQVSECLQPEAAGDRGELYGFDPSWVIMANGSDEVLNNLIRAFAAEGEEIGYVHPSYSYYATLAEIQGATGPHLSA